MRDWVKLLRDEELLLLIAALVWHVRDSDSDNDNDTAKRLLVDRRSKALDTRLSKALDTNR